MKSTRTSAFSLVEVTMALGVCAVCLLVVVALIPTAQQASQNSSEQQVASSIAESVVSDLRSMLPAASSASPSPRYSISVPVSGGTGTPQTIYFADALSPLLPPNTPALGSNPVSRYRATVYLTPPPNGRSATTGRIFVTWPALADPIPSATPVNYKGSLETFFALDRN